MNNGMYVNPAYVNVNQMNGYVNQMRNDFGFQNVTNMPPDINQMSYGVNGNLGQNTNQYYYDCYGNMVQQQQPIDPYTINYLTPEAQQSYNYYMSHQNELQYADPEIQQLVMGTLNGQQINLNQGPSVGFNNPYEQALMQGYQPQPQQQNYYDPYAGYYNSNVNYNNYGYYQQPQSQPYYGNQYYEDTSKMPAYQREEYEAVHGKRFKMSNYDTSYNPFTANPINQYEYQRQQQLEYQEKLEAQQANKYSLEVISQSMRNFMGITEEQYMEEQRRQAEENRRLYQQQYQYMMEIQNMNNLAALDRSCTDEQFVDRKEELSRQIFYNNLYQAKQEMPDDMEIIDMFKVLTKKNIEIHDREAQAYYRSNMYNSASYQNGLNKQLYQNGNQYVGLDPNFRNGSGTREPVGDCNIGPFQMRTDSKTGVVNVSCQSEYIKKREAFLTQVKIANNNMNKGQSIGGYIIDDNKGSGPNDNR